MTAASAAGCAAFAASQDADSEGEEGRFYVWSEAEIDALLGADSAVFKQAYDVTGAGNWEGKTILRRVSPPGDPAAEARLAHSRAVLFGARARRVAPGRDDKVLADWNGLMIAALCRAAAVFERPEWLGLAESALDFVLTQMQGPDGRVQHAWRLNRVTAAGLLEDQAAVARAALAVFEATGDPRRLVQAIRIAEAAYTWFADPHGSYYMTAADAADVPLGAAGRQRTALDNATPSGNGVMAEVLARLFHLSGDQIWRERAEAVVAAFGGKPETLAGSPTLLGAADLLEAGISVVIAGAPALPGTIALRRVALRAPDPAVCVLQPSTGAVAAGHPALGKTAPPGRALAYLCRAGTCSPPIEDPVALTAELRAGAAT
ncbi:MAG: thioredoxin domain-containing protein [Alphaproteobacteria bacterium]|nr:thioredoxin domain-containing protein [Alphaproteobacteria bacterium]